MVKRMRGLLRMLPVVFLLMSAAPPLPGEMAGNAKIVFFVD
jgi:hypothetical protein